MRNKIGSFKVVGFFIAGVFYFSLVGSGMAQQNPAGPPAGAGPPPNNNPNLQDRARQIDESRLRSAESVSNLENENAKRVQAAIANMKEDFRRIQIVRNDIARGLLSRKPLDYKLISEQTGEINKRAARLKVYMLARVSDAEKIQSEDQKDVEMIDAMLRLCKLIDSFTENPALKNAAEIDSKEPGKAAEYKTRADRDLNAIINLSHNLQRQSDKLKNH
ncbi:MAG: hypothetical protein ABR555_17260 [Pyrinomonadaceae bacterium]